ncbi:putative ATP-dependent RNA helicase DHX57 [Biomphalaria glabrata]|uniref:Putative ATP-dependent RNA helicase DHX57 n=1 Tax=Biomphalaria glabrata TaxID=6526 RepID=A0A9W2ZTB0_BIOGL|nr:putative ATP-dependent RNA helicase DHX57 [Biomphalaria glabrata]
MMDDDFYRTLQNLLSHMESSQTTEDDYHHKTDADVQLHQLSISDLSAQILDVSRSSNMQWLEVHPDTLELIKKTLEPKLSSKFSPSKLVSGELAYPIQTQKPRYLKDFDKINIFLHKEFQVKIPSHRYLKLQEERQKLPTWEMRDQIISTLNNHNVVIICGMTGCGKTTQVPQFILDDALKSETFNANIVCTQPRRISAMSIAERVAQERDERVGRVVGYQIRLDAELSLFTRLLFCTTGIVLRRLEDDPLLEGVSHMIVDEVHERSEQSDFLLLVLKKLLRRHSHLKVILMSATIDARLFSDYFNKCPVIEIPGKTYSVKQFFLEDIIEKTNYRLDYGSDYAKRDSLPFDYHLMYQKRELPLELRPDAYLNEDELQSRYEKHRRQTVSTLARMDLDCINYELIIHLLEWIVNGEHKDLLEDGAILVFLPGIQEIQNTFEMLQASREFSKENYAIIPLHSSYSSEEQKMVFRPTARGMRKIVLATNIAETSVTINDVVFVVDTGVMKEKRYDPEKGMLSLDLIRVSKTNAIQRMGRAGRVQAGVCFHMFTSHMYQHELRDHPKPEIQRNSLEQVVIRTKILPIFRKYNAQKVLRSLINPPAPESVEQAVDFLKHLGALDSASELTALGYHLGSLPVDVRIGKLMLYGTIFRCLDATLTIAATISFKSPFIIPFKKKEEAAEKKKEFETNNSDILTMLQAYKTWWLSRAARDYHFCKKNYLSYKALEMIKTLKQQYVENLSDIGFIRKGIKTRDVQSQSSYISDGVWEITGPEVNVNNENMELLSALLVAALYPNIIEIVPQATNLSGSGERVSRTKFKTEKGEYVDIHPSSVNFQHYFKIGSFLVYHEKVKTKKVYIRDCSLVSKFSLLMFAGGKITITGSSENIIVKIDDMIMFKVRTIETAALLKSLRSKLDQLLSDKISQPDMDLIRCSDSESIINCIVQIISDPRMSAKDYVEEVEDFC